ncbi:MAG: SAM-dependent methyltransferase [Candidatus Micrarchaeaceae archaeon]
MIIRQNGQQKNLADPEKIGLLLRHEASSTASRATNTLDMGAIRIPKLNLTGIDQTVKEAILEEIRAYGPMPFSRFMELSLYCNNGHYAKKTSFSDIGFRTTAEDSGLFGATIGNGFARLWKAMGKPERFDIFEMGAGSGKLARDLMLYAQLYNSDFYKAINYVIVELTEARIMEQRACLQSFADKISWIRASAYDLPVKGINGAFVSNELVDAFPIEIVTRKNGSIRQRYISADEDGVLVVGWGNPSPEVIRHIKENGIGVEEGKNEPINLMAEKLQKRLDMALEKGAILTIDYGDKTNSLNGFSSGKPIRAYPSDKLFRYLSGEIEMLEQKRLTKGRYEGIMIGDIKLLRDLESIIGKSNSEYETRMANLRKSAGKYNKGDATEEDLAQYKLLRRLYKYISRSVGTWPAYVLPGEFDITADVNFSVLEKIAISDGLRYEFFGHQDKLLKKFGYNEVYINVAGDIGIKGALYFKIGSIDKSVGRHERFMKKIQPVSDYEDYNALLLTKGVYGWP